ncbi:unnamed protein product [Urochloa humidicola]
MGRQCHQAITRVGLFTLVVTTISIQLAALAAVASDVRPAAKVPAMYVFGDSTMDVGNNNYLPGDFPRANQPYYGVDFPGGARPTGRWSNGYNIADFIAKAVGFKRSPPAYLSLITRNSSRRRLILKGLGGVSYASAGAGILDSTFAGKYIPLSKQVRYFAATKREMVATLGACAAMELLSESLFLISIGSNDIAVFAAAQQQSPQTNTSADAVAAYYSSLVSNYSAAIKGLYGMGARKFVIVNAGLIGCTPSARVQSPAGSCSGGANALAAGFNDALRSLMASLAHRLPPGLAYSIGDLYGVMRAAVADPRPAGLSNVDSACCGGGRLGAQSGGGCRPNSTLCADRRRYLFWDSSGHPTQRAAQLVASAFYDGPAQFAAPLNLKQLVRRSRVNNHNQ